MLCSPYDKGFRLLAFDQHCGDLCGDMGVVGTREPSRLVQLDHFQNCHPEAVLSRQMFNATFSILETFGFIIN